MSSVALGDEPHHETIAKLKTSTWERLYDSCGPIEGSKEIEQLYSLAYVTVPIRHQVIAFDDRQYAFHSLPSQACKDPIKKSHSDPDCRMGTNIGPIQWTVRNLDEIEFQLTARDREDLPDVWGGRLAYTKNFKLEFFSDSLLVLSTLDGTGSCFGQRWHIYLVPALVN